MCSYCQMIGAEFKRLLMMQVVAEFDLDEIALQRGSWGLFRDRRPDLYNVLLTKDGSTLPPMTI